MASTTTKQKATEAKAKVVKMERGFLAKAKKALGSIGRLGKAMMFPTAVLPVAAIMLRVGAQVPTDTEFANFVSVCLSGIGNAVFGNLPIIFAVGIGFGLTKDNRGEAALATLLGIILLKLIMSTAGGDLPSVFYKKVVDFHTMFGDKYDSIMSNNVLNGVIVGCLVAFIYNRFSGVELPKVLGFFSGRRLIPALALLSIMIFTILYAIIFPWIGWVLNEISSGLTDATGNRWANSAIQGIYVFINRLMIPFGLHHVPNTLFWFQLGDHPDATGTVIHGDINIFISGIAKGNNAGTFQSPFFPMMMFGIPALVAAMCVMADNKEQRIRVTAMLGGSALVSFLTGITEPVEFAFLFAAPWLYVIHAFIGAIFGFITGVFQIQLGFGFSAGFLDYLLSIPKSMDIIRENRTGIDAVLANPAWIFVIGFVCATTYFFVAKWAIKKFNILTPGRGANQIAGADEDKMVSDEQGFSNKAKSIVAALGGYKNIENFQSCMTRLRYDVKDASIIDQAALKAAGSLGFIQVNPKHVHVIIGQTAELLNDEIKNNKPAANKTAAKA